MADVTLKVLPNSSGEFTVTRDSTDYTAVVPTCMENKVDQAILAFAKGVCTFGYSHQTPVVPLVRKQAVGATAYNVDDVIYTEPDEE